MSPIKFAFVFMFAFMICFCLRMNLNLWLSLRVSDCVSVCSLLLLRLRFCFFLRLCLYLRVCLRYICVWVLFLVFIRVKFRVRLKVICYLWHNSFPVKFKVELVILALISIERKDNSINLTPVVFLPQRAIYLRTSKKTFTWL
jgi:hypothetical protein